MTLDPFSIETNPLATFDPVERYRAQQLISEGRFPVDEGASSHDAIATMLQADIVPLRLDQMRLSYSMISAWQKCRKLWDWQYSYRYSPIERSQPMDLGSAVHKALEYVLLNPSLGTDEAIEAGIQAWLAETRDRIPVFLDEESGEVIETSLESVAEDARRITPRAIAYLDLDRWETVLIDGHPAVEITLEQPMPPFRSYVGKVDWIAREKANGYAWLFEFKTRKAFHSESDEDVDMQKASYQYILNQLGIPTIGTITFQIGTKPPQWPKQNKDGQMSRVPILTTWDMYRKALEQFGLDPADYLDMQLKLENKKFFELTRAYRSEGTVSAIWNDIIVPVAADIARESRSTYRTMNKFNCQKCSFRVPCIAELNGEDAQYLLSTLYSRYVPS